MCSVVCTAILCVAFYTFMTRHTIKICLYKIYNNIAIHIRSEWPLAKRVQISQQNRTTRLRRTLRMWTPRARALPATHLYMLRLLLK